MNPKYITSISELDNLVGLAPKAREKMETVTELFPFRSNDYYLSLIDWKDGHDPLRRIVSSRSRGTQKPGDLLILRAKKIIPKNPACSINMIRPAFCSSPMSAAASAASVSGNACSCPANARP